MYINDKFQRRRLAWSDLSDKDRLKRYRQALVAFQNGVIYCHPGLLEEFALRQLALDTQQRPALQGKQKPVLPMPSLFDSPERTLLLAMLFANGPMTVREMARARDVNSSSTFRTTDRLLRSGLVVKRKREGGRKYVALNRAHVAFQELKALLETLASHYGTPLIEQARYRHGFPLERDPAPPLVERHMFGSALRSRMLVLLGSLEGADATQLSRLLAERLESVHYAAHALRRAGILTSTQVGGRQIFHLSNSYTGAAEFRALLDALLREAPVYGVLRDLLPNVTIRWR